MERAYKDLLTEGMHQISISDLIERLSHIEQAYKLTEFLPKNLKTALTTIEELEAELSKDMVNDEEIV
ncbi:MAG: hypothetical protein K0R73_1060 [Candidatus Midichloriaceae bacterium]|jgi:hypothetical protein|nr:hypothetical protein [Candidatus Midichloriaceae bacterium]